MMVPDKYGFAEDVIMGFDTLSGRFVYYLNDLVILLAFVNLQATYNLIILKWAALLDDVATASQRANSF